MIEADQLLPPPIANMGRLTLVTARSVSTVLDTWLRINLSSTFSDPT